MTVSCRRSAAEVGNSGAAAGGSADGALVCLVPHSKQNFALDGLSVPHEVQGVGTGHPHWAQNLLPAGIVALQLGQSIPHPINVPSRSENEPAGSLDLSARLLDQPGSLDRLPRQIH